MPDVRAWNDAPRMAGATAVRHGGKVVSVVGTLVRVIGLQLRVGDLCRIYTSSSDPGLMGEVIGIENEQMIVMPLGSMTGLSSASMVEATGGGLLIPQAKDLLGRVVDGFCRPLDQRPLVSPRVRPVTGDIPSPLSRPVIDEPFITGVGAIDGLLTCGVGQRVGIFAPAGVGKTSLLGMLARFSAADAIVVALIGERGREVQEFMQHALGDEALQRSTIVVATSDRPAAERIKTAHTASAIAEELRADGRRVLLLFDSLTRFARALREVGLAAGEPPARRGFPPSVFAALPGLLERSGRNEAGSITAYYTVLAEDDDGSDPVCEEARSLLDGHIVLSSELAAEGHYPAIDILASKSRVMQNVCGHEHLGMAKEIRKWMADYKKSELLIRLGEYRPGIEPELDEAVRKKTPIAQWLSQSSQDARAWESTQASMRKLTGG
ncbi:FliI/YscN family ATPase [Dyella flava]|uniref:protein-secreting ATPase n=1 Tax=Dyella flava TaxID=1920170 RepID=A0ABS2K6F6_9GAMM|nr:FliI/YscN family ATPase [Dyella flava]MBM7126776.1 FliI/YscN family ATPase [Dyella flava]GLQ49399.1 EscN/YscN/HrcN family type III secretion system ATPase [Dyella flava]